MVYIISFRLASGVRQYVLCHPDGKVIHFSNGLPDPKWEWFTANHDAFTFRFPEGVEVSNLSLQAEPKQVAERIKGMMGTNWEPCCLKHGIVIPRHLCA